MKKLFSCALATGLGILLFCTPCQAGQVLADAYQQPIRCGTVTSSKLQEISGLSVSRISPGLLWVVNDSRNPAELYGISTKGVLLKTFTIEHAANLDWEELAGFHYKGQDFLVIADVGDNRAIRPFASLYCVKEPAPGTGSGTLVPEWEMRFWFEDGPLDCEAVAVDAANEKIYLLSKRKFEPVLYELPLDMACKKFMYTARAVTEIRTIPGPTDEDLKHNYGKHRSHPTAMDISADGNSLYILTYKNACVYSRTPGQTWASAFSNPPQQITLPDPSKIMVQREALGLDQANGALFITSEKIPAPIYVVKPFD